MKIGNDIVNLSRVKQMYERKGIPSKIYTEAEIQHINNLKLDSRKIERMAGKYAVKESVVKAFGTGIGEVSLIDIEVLAEIGGKPVVKLYGRAKEIFDSNYTEIDVSISHDGDYAYAVCVIA